jgi:hypothetical protein
VLLRVPPEVVVAQPELSLDALFQPVELRFAGSDPNQPLFVVTCDEPALRPRMRPPRVACRTVAELPTANANGRWEVRGAAARSGTLKDLTGMRVLGAAGRGRPVVPCVARLFRCIASARAGR